MRLFGGPGGIEFWLLPLGVVVGLTLCVVIVLVDEYMNEGSKNEE